MVLQYVKGVKLSNGSVYNGCGYYEYGKFIPHGMGVCAYSGHQEVGIYRNGVLNGISYFNYHTWMQVGVVKDKVISGWGAKIVLGEITFGVYQNGVLKKDLTQLVEPFWEDIKESCAQLQKGIISALKTGNIGV